MQCNSRFMSSFSIIFRIVVSLLLLFSFSLELLADVCVWRDPEKTMIVIFPEARDYKMLDREISNEKRAAIEKRIGKPLDPAEQESWTHYEIVGNDGKPLGYIIADAEKGEYGVIEVVMGITPDARVKQIYIQRARERNKEFKSKDFLNQFVGKTKDDPVALGKDISAESSTATSQVAFAVKKMLVMFDELH